MEKLSGLETLSNPEISNAAEPAAQPEARQAEEKQKKAKRPIYSEPVNKLYFKAREWVFNKDCKKNVGSRSFMEGPDGVIAEAFTIGNWGWDWTEIVSKTLILPKNTLNTFTFWLNGGENENSNEVCKFEVVFNNDWESRLTYNLNRNFIKPVKRLNGWELYEIPFRTENNEYTQLKFVAQLAYLTIMDAQDVSVYEDLPDTVDKFEGERPQRHNIVFSDGWPMNEWYSTAALEKKHRFDNSGKTVQISDGSISKGDKTIITINGDLSENSAKNLMKQGHEKVIINGRIYKDKDGGTGDDMFSVDAIEDFVNSINIDDLVNADEIENRIHDKINNALSEAANEGNIDVDDITENVVDEVMDDIFDNLRDRLENISDQLQEKIDSVDDMGDNLKEDYSGRIRNLIYDKLKELNF